MRFPTMWYVRPSKAQTSLRICAVWSKPLLVTWIFYEYKATDWTSFGVSKLKRRLHRFVWVYSCQNATLLEITCHGSNDLSTDFLNLLVDGACSRKQIFKRVNHILNFLVDHANSRKEIFKRVCHFLNLLVESSDNLILLLNVI